LEVKEVAGGLDRLVVLDVDLDVTAGLERVGVGAGVAYELAEIDAFATEQSMLVEVGEEQQVLDELGGLLEMSSDSTSGAPPPSASLELGVHKPRPVVRRFPLGAGLQRGRTLLRQPAVGLHRGPLRVVEHSASVQADEEVG
jgi:hypothetical protein